MGIQSHSKQSKKAFIFSVSQEKLDTRVNVDNYLVAKDLLELRGLQYKELTGCYKGQKELSLLVHEEALKAVEHLVNKYNQECYLELDSIGAHGLRRATLVYRSPAKRKFIGYFRSRNKCVAERHDSYTIDKSTGLFYIVEKDYTEASQFNKQ